LVPAKKLLVPAKKLLVPGKKLLVPAKKLLVPGKKLLVPAKKLFLFSPAEKLPISCDEAVKFISKSAVIILLVFIFDNYYY